MLKVIEWITQIISVSRRTKDKIISCKWKASKRIKEENNKSSLYKYRQRICISEMGKVIALQIKDTRWIKEKFKQTNQNYWIGKINEWKIKTRNRDNAFLVELGSLRKSNCKISSRISSLECKLAKNSTEDGVCYSEKYEWKYWWSF